MDDTKKKLRQLNKLAWEKEKGGMCVCVVLIEIVSYYMTRDTQELGQQHQKEHSIHQEM